MAIGMRFLALQKTKHEHDEQERTQLPFKQVLETLLNCLACACEENSYANTTRSEGMSQRLGFVRFSRSRTRTIGHQIPRIIARSHIRNATWRNAMLLVVFSMNCQRLLSNFKQDCEIFHFQLNRSADGRTPEQPQCVHAYFMPQTNFGNS